MVFCVRLLHLAQKLSPVPGNSSWITAFSAEFCERLTSAPGEESIHKLRENVFQEHKTLREKELEMGPKASHSYGRKFGVEQDRMDKSAVGLEYQSKLSKCCLQVDSIWGFGGKFGVQLARVDQLFCSRWLFTRTWEAPRDTQGRTLSAGRFTGHRGHRLGTSPTLGLRAGGDTPQRPPDRLLTPAADRTPWLTQPSHQGRSQN
ncbi:hematopoietic lineage cell-specific protein-like isoform X9 [Cervus elaphus]|uniref:hematopoietic lineage cell-specific protein-like isoform X9 n=1 Tax=Cervus elaphus TaxID=9860 RepID=UPI001CC2DCED|nr:hematopoietic lineage cell-specific protein-like isoform X9 [Cervus elaphus]